MFTVLQPLILASESPRRQQFFLDLKLDFRVVPPLGEEPRLYPEETPEDYAMRIADLKGQGVAQANPEAVVVAADTIVVLGRDILGKPSDENEALAMLERLSGVTHSVITAVSIHFPAEHVCFYKESRVRFHAWTRAILQSYVHTGEPLDKAGAYAVQGLGSFLIESIEGSWTSVVGLPLSEVMEVLLEYGVVSSRREPSSAQHVHGLIP